MRIKQGTILPTTGIGTGYVLLIIYLTIIYNAGVEIIWKNPMVNILPFVLCLMQFSYKDFFVGPLDENLIDDKELGYYIIYRPFGIQLFEKFHRWDEYSVIVLRVLNTKYNVAQGGTDGMTSATHVDSKIVLVGRNKTSKEVQVICSGTKKELDTVINRFIQPQNIPVYLGAPKKGYEYQVDHIEP